MKLATPVSKPLSIFLQNHLHLSHQLLLVARSEGHWTCCLLWGPWLALRPEIYMSWTIQNAHISCHGNNPNASWEYHWYSWGTQPHGCKSSGDVQTLSQKEQSNTDNLCWNCNLWPYCEMARMHMQIYTGFHANKNGQTSLLNVDWSRSHISLSLHQAKHKILSEAAQDQDPLSWKISSVAM